MFSIVVAAIIRVCVCAHENDTILCVVVADMKENQQKIQD